jgi:hypothetical protein
MFFFDQVIIFLVQFAIVQVLHSNHVNFMEDFKGSKVKKKQTGRYIFTTR